MNGVSLGLVRKRKRRFSVVYAEGNNGVGSTGVLIPCLAHIALISFDAALHWVSAKVH